MLPLPLLLLPLPLPLPLPPPPPPLPLLLRLADLACVYHLGQDNGTVITGNLCTNVSSHGYGGDAYYTDQGSQNVNISSNVAYDVKCAGFQENFGMGQ